MEESSPEGSCLLASNSSLYSIGPRALSHLPLRWVGKVWGWAFLVQEVIGIKVRRKETNTY